MFEKKPVSVPYSAESTTTVQSVETIIGEGAVFEGVITTKTALRIDGAVTGDIKSSGTVIVGVSGVVDGTINAKELFIAGKVHGNVTTAEKTEFVASGYLQGDLATGELIVQKGAAFDGNCKMNCHNDKTAKPLDLRAGAKPELRDKVEVRGV